MVSVFLIVLYFLRSARSVEGLALWVDGTMRVRVKTWGRGQSTLLLVSVCACASGPDYVPPGMMVLKACRKTVARLRTRMLMLLVGIFESWYLMGLLTLSIHFLSLSFR